LIFEALESLVQEVIMPALKEGTWVICTRYSPSAFVYQGWVGGMDMMELKRLADNATQHLKPDLIILLDLTEEEILRRLGSAKDSEKHVYNEQERDLIKKRREGFLALSKDGNWDVVEACVSREEIASKIWGIVAEKLNLN